MTVHKVAVIGGGAWGAALAQLCASKGLETRLWVRRDEIAADITQKHRSEYLPGIALDPSLSASTNPAILSDAATILCVVPAQSSRKVLAALKPHLKPDATLVLCQKGIERDTLMLPDAVAREVAPGHPVAILTGPSFAADVAAGLPTAVTIASESPEQAVKLQDLFATTSFRPYPSDDMIGAQVGGAIKNVLAIACGIVVAKGLGESARAAIIARGFAEMTRLAEAMGGRRDTVTGLSGLGDLVLTCGSAQSRNFSLGLRIGKDETSETGTTCEGAASASGVVALANQWQIDCPICFTVSEIVSGNLSIDNAVENLMHRPLQTSE